MTYLEMLRARYDALIAAIDEIQNRAAADGPTGRDLTAEELTDVEARSAEATALVPQIERVHAQNLRNASVDAMAARVAQDGQTPPAGAPVGEPLGGQLDRHDGGRPTGTAQTQDRDPGHYLKGGERSFFSDLLRSRMMDDYDARDRLNEHNRALSTGVAGAGIVPPQWLTEEYEATARQGRVVVNAVRNIELNNPSPMTLPRQSGDTAAAIAEQATENTHPGETDGFATTTDTVTPKPTSGIQVVSRQMIDMTNPAADVLIFQDMLGVYNRKVEDAVVAKMVTAAGTAVTTFATEAAFNGTSPAQPAVDAVIDAAFEVWNARKLPASIAVMRIRRWQKFNKMRDSTGRKLFPTSDAGPMNVDGVGSVQASGNIDGLPVLVTEGLGTTAYPESILVARASDIIFWEGPMKRFTFEEVAGPESVKLGIWAYTASIVRQSANSVRRVVITAAS